MKKLILTLTFLLSNPALAVSDQAFEILNEQDAFYFYGDDGVDCNARLTIKSIDRFIGATVNVSYDVEQNYFVHGCSAHTYHCKAQVDLQTESLVKGSLSCNQN